MPRHLRPTAPIAPEALLPGDPKRAMELANRVLERPVMSNLSRGLWGYHGLVADGRALTVQSTGLGGPSAAIVVTELAELGVARAIRIGTCVALDPALATGDTVVATAALAGDGVGTALGGPARADPGLVRLMRAATAPSHAGPVASTDLYYDDRPPDRRARWRDAGAVALDLSAGAVLAVGRRTGIAAACVLVVAEAADGTRLADDELDDAALALGERAALALAGAQGPSGGAAPA